MKKFLALMLSLMLVLCAFASCGSEPQVEETDANAGQSVGTNDGNNDNNDTDTYAFEGSWEAVMTLYDLNPELTEITLSSTGSGDSSAEDTDATEATEGSSEPATDAETPESIIANINKLASETTITCTLTFTGDKYTFAMDAAEFNNAVNVLADICIDRLAVTNSDMTIEDFFKDNGTTEEQFRADIIANMGSATESGSWSYADGKLTLGDVTFIFSADDEENFDIHNDDVFYYYTKK